MLNSGAILGATTNPQFSSFSPVSFPPSECENLMGPLIANCEVRVREKDLLVRDIQSNHMHYVEIDVFLRIFLFSPLLTHYTPNSTTTHPTPFFL